jgi:uncharacterized protein (DUF952 family)
MFRSQALPAVCKHAALRYRRDNDATQVTMTVIYHMADRAAWLAAVSVDAYFGTAQDQVDGFIHFSTASQVEESAAKHRKGVKNLVLIAIDAEVLGSALRWETARGAQLFPHHYGSLTPSMVRAVYDLPLGDDGKHVFPPLR